MIITALPTPHSPVPTSPNRLAPPPSVLPPPASALSPQSSAPTPAKRVNLSGIGAKPTAAKKSTEYPVFESEADLKATVDWVLANNEVPDQLKSAKAQITEVVTPMYFERSSGKVEVPSSVIVPGTQGSVLVMFANKYSAVDAERLEEIIPGRVEQFFRDSFKLEIDGDKIPADRAQDIIGELQALFDKYGCTEALSARQQQVPKADFHARRHLDLTPELNLAMQKVCRIQSSVKVKK